MDYDYINKINFSNPQKSLIVYLTYMLISIIKLFSSIRNTDLTLLLYIYMYVYTNISIHCIHPNHVKAGNPSSMIMMERLFTFYFFYFHITLC